jgi:hypothetical protein
VHTACLVGSTEGLARSGSSVRVTEFSRRWLPPRVGVTPDNSLGLLLRWHQWGFARQSAQLALAVAAAIGIGASVWSTIPPVNPLV